MSGGTVKFEVDFVPIGIFHPTSGSALSNLLSTTADRGAAVAPESDQGRQGQIAPSWAS